MESMTPDEREQYIQDRVHEILTVFNEFQGKDISKLSIKNRDKYIEGRVASDLAISDELLVQLKRLLELYETHVHRASNTAALLFLINGIDLERASVDAIAKVEVRKSDPDDAERTG